MAVDPNEPPLVFALPESAPLALRIAEAAQARIAPLEDRRFESGEFKLRSLVTVRQRQVAVIQTLAGTPDAPAAERLVRLLFLLAALRDAGATQRITLIPYLAYARKDRRTQPRDPVNTRYVAELLEAAGATRLIALDVHNPAALDNAFRIPVDHLSAQPLFATALAASIGPSPLAVASPDVGGIKRAQLFQERLELATRGAVELAFLEKRRVGGVVRGETLAGEVANREVLVLDDLCASGGTLLRAATAFRAAGAARVRALVTHVPQPDGLARLLADDRLDGVITTDSVGPALTTDVAASSPQRLRVLPIAPLLGEALRRAFAGESIADLHVPH